tara:strand:+ start:4106 stop:5167 length:1062 start_codon:yes stop_codon:yes gene_type:complete
MVARKIRGTWHIDVRHEGRRYRLPSPVNTKAAATEYERQVRTRLLYGQPVDGKPASPLFADYAPEWLQMYAEVYNKPSTADNRRAKLRKHLVPLLGKYRLEEITTRHIDRLISQLQARGLGNRTVNHMLELLRVMLGVAVEWGQLSAVPKMRRLKVLDMPPRYLSQEEADRLLDHVPDDHRCLILTALRTGLRKGELLGLQWSDIDLDHSMITVARTLYQGTAQAPKSGKTRQVPISPELKIAIAEHRHIRGPWVFCQSGGEVLTSWAPNTILRHACLSAGIESITFHALRHTFASHLVLAGVHLRVVQELLGHHSIVVTQKYAHLQPQQSATAVSLLDRKRLADIMGTIWAN